MPPPDYTGFLKLLYNWQTIIAGALALAAGLIAAGLVVCQVRLIKRQVAFSTYLDLDKEWNSKEMIKTRQEIYPDNGKQSWDTSRLKGILNFLKSSRRCLSCQATCVLSTKAPSVGTPHIILFLLAHMGR
jgi:hypothetical protein